MEEDFEPAIQHQRRVNPKIHDVIKQQVIKLLEAGLIYPISNSLWVSLVHCVPKKGGFKCGGEDCSHNGLKSHKRAIAWKLSDIKGINSEFCTHKIILEEDFTPVVQHQRRVNPKIHDVIKQEGLGWNLEIEDEDGHEEGGAVEEVWWWVVKIEKEDGVSQWLITSSYRDLDNKERGVLWNPLIRKSVAIDVPSMVHFTKTITNTVHDKTVVGFRVCRRTNDPKIVKITTNPPFVTEEWDCTIIWHVWKVEAFTLRSGTCKRQCFTRNLDEFIYWLAFDGSTKKNAELKWYDLIMSIDMTSEEFTQENVDRSLRACAYHSKICEVASSIHFRCKQPCSGHNNLLKKEDLTWFEFVWWWIQTPWISWPKGAKVDLFISNLRRHLANKEAEKVYYFWIKDKSVPKSILERFDIGEPHGCIKVYEERNYEECASDGSGDDFKQDALFIYKPHSHEINSITIFGIRYSLYACREQDQLFLLDHYNGCALFRKKFKEDLFTSCVENGILQDSSEPSNGNTNVANALQEPFVVIQDPGKNSSQSPLQINHHCCYGCGDPLEGTMLIPACYDDDDDNYNFAITPNEPDNSLSMGDEHLDTVSATKLDEFIKSSVENLVPNPNESEGEPEYDVPVCEVFTTFSNILFDVDYDFYSRDDQSFFGKDFPKEIYLNPLFDEEIISMKIEPHHFNAEFDFIESLLNHDSSIISSSSKIDSLFDEFAGELTHLKSILLGINETDCDPEEETRFIKRLLYDNSSPRPLEEFVSENFDAAIESFSPFPILVEDIDSPIEEINLSFTPDYPMPSGIEEDDYDSKRNILIIEELLSNDSLSFPKNESFHSDIPSSSRPPAKLPDGNTGILNVKMMGDISEQKVPMPRLMFTHPTIVSNQEKSLELLPHQGMKIFSLLLLNAR
uniref:Reverse transcriptase domain-containing protein n=1 Tax=Tanacetum cinerariifolium TaxID=118510 RepID=A0A6L2L5Z0_TANCI|nr:reverse transcriptase domain-containing protein [Tanacetum cinerariifolium]